MRNPQRCQRCKTITSQVIINSRAIRKDGSESISWMCNPCAADRTRNYYKRNKQSYRATVYKSIAKHLPKQLARYALNQAVRNGTLARPSNCEDCGKDCKPHGHHEDYNKPLEVNWVCTTCHSDRHQEHRAVVNSANLTYN